MWAVTLIKAKGKAKAHHCGKVTQRKSKGQVLEMLRKKLDFPKA